MIFNSILLPVEDYDFIIIGAGSAGCVLANRLSEIKNWKILLLEAGKVENDLSILPVAAPGLQLTHYDWQYTMEFDPGFAGGMINNILAYPRGKGLGGTSIINYMIYTRGNPVDYDRWAALGNPGWSYQEVLPYFLKSENASLKFSDPKYHNTNGYLSVQDTYQSELVYAFIEAGEELGYKRVDYAGPAQIGFNTVLGTVKKGRRHSVAKAFLKPIIGRRKNLHIITSAFVTKVLIDPRSYSVYGVEFTARNGEKKTALASKEVVLSAGTFNSAQLLMLAGVGPKPHLDQLGIKTLINLPVGEFMQDHTTFVGLTFLINQDVSASIRTSFTSNSFREFLDNGTGPGASLGGVEGLAYIKTGLSEESDPNYPDMELLFVGAALNSDLGLVTRRSMRIRDDVYETIWGKLSDVPTWTIFPMLVHPRSIGHMKLRSRSPYTAPLFYGNYFSDPEQLDLRTFIAAIRFVEKLADTEAFRRYGSKLWDVPIPGCEMHVFDSHGYWECALRTLSITLHHQVGTNRMGPVGDPRAVVDHELKVHGLHRLRVADCSVIPFALTAHTNAPSVMIGEKAADLIKEYWGVFNR